MNLDHSLGQIDPYSNNFTSCSLIHGNSPFENFRLMTRR
jgi:hypothetical protein